MYWVCGRANAACECIIDAHDALSVRPQNRSTWAWRAMSTFPGFTYIPPKLSLMLDSGSAGWLNRSMHRRKAKSNGHRQQAAQFLLEMLSSPPRLLRRGCSINSTSSAPVLRFTNSIVCWAYSLVGINAGLQTLPRISRAASPVAQCLLLNLCQVHFHRWNHAGVLFSFFQCFSHILDADGVAGGHAGDFLVEVFYPMAPKCFVKASCKAISARHTYAAEKFHSTSFNSRLISRNMRPTRKSQLFHAALFSCRCSPRNVLTLRVARQCLYAVLRRNLHKRILHFINGF